MGSGSSKSDRKASGADSAQRHNLDEEKPVKNWEGEVIGWVPLTDSERMKRRALKNPPRLFEESTFNDDDDSDHDDFGKKSDNRRWSDDDSYGRNSGNKWNHRRRSSAESTDYRRQSTHSNKSEYTYLSSDGGRYQDSRRNSYSRKSSPSNSPYDRSAQNSGDSRYRSASSDRRRSSYRGGQKSGSDSGDSRYRSSPANARRKSSFNYGRESDGSRKNSVFTRGSRKNSVFSTRKFSPAERRRGRSANSDEEDDDEDNRSSYSSNSRYSSARTTYTGSEKAGYEPVKEYLTPQPTLLPKKKFSRELAVSLLHKAFKGLGTQEKLIVDVLGGHSSDQRKEIAQWYKGRYRKDLIETLRDELNGDFRYICVCLVTDDLIFDVETVRVFLEQDSLHMSLIGLLARTGAQGLKLIKKTFAAEYKDDLIRKIETETSKTFTDVFKAIFSGKRETGRKVDYDSAQKDAEELINGWRNESDEVFEMLLLHVIGHRNANQVREVCEAFRQLTEKELTDVAQTVLGQKAAVPFNAHLEACDDAPFFFAGCIQHCLSGAGTDEIGLSRIIISRAEIDMQDVIDAYEHLFHKPLIQEIKKETSGDYQRVLLKLLNAK